MDYVYLPHTDWIPPRPFLSTYVVLEWQKYPLCSCWCQLVIIVIKFLLFDILNFCHVSQPITFILRHWNNHYAGEGSLKCGCSGCSCTHTFFRKTVLHPQKSIKTREYSGISPQIDGFWFLAPTTFNLLCKPCKKFTISIRCI